jgi:hypothetical protein
LHIQETEISGKFKKEVTNEGSHNLYTEDEKTGNARILNLVFSPFDGMFDNGIRVVSSEGSSTVIVLVARGGVVVKALRYKPGGSGFDSRWCHWNFSVT